MPGITFHHVFLLQSMNGLPVYLLPWQSLSVSCRVTGRWQDLSERTAGGHEEYESSNRHHQDG